MRSRMRSIFAFASASDVISLTLTRMWRARDCSTTVGWLRLRVSSSLTMWKPADERSRPDTSPGFRLRTGSAKTVGSRAGGAPAEVAARERVGRVGEAGRDLGEVGPGPDLLQRLLGAPALGVDLVGRRLLGHEHQHVREPVLDVAADLRVDGGEEVVDLGVGHDDAAVDLALAQPLHGDLAADVVAVLRRRESPRDPAPCGTPRATACSPARCAGSCARPARRRRGCRSPWRTASAPAR